MRNANSIIEVYYSPKIRVLDETSLCQTLRMRSRSTDEVAAMDSCFALIRDRQHCIVKHYEDTKSFHSAQIYTQGGPTDVGLFKPDRATTQQMWGLWQ